MTEIEKKTAVGAEYKEVAEKTASKAPSGRNKNIDILRAVATLMVVIYHCWILTGGAPLKIRWTAPFITLGGEIGVTLFFLLSGFGIYSSLSNTDSKGKIRFFPFMKKRVKRICPEYYQNLLICLLFTSGAGFLTLANMKNIVSHFFFLHSFFYQWSGSINGVLWTMGVIFQFYVLSIPLYYVVKKQPVLALLLSVIISLVSKYALFNYLAGTVYGSTYNFWAERMLLCSVLDCFVPGMVIAHFSKKHKHRKYDNILGLIAIVLAIVLIYHTCQNGYTYGIHTTNLSGYSWHTLISLELTLLMLGTALFRTKRENIIYKAFLWLSHIEFSIYLWHLVMINALIKNCPIIISLMDGGHYMVLYVILLSLSIFVGWGMNSFKFKL